MPGAYSGIVASSRAMTVKFFVLEYYNLRLQRDPLLWNWYGHSYSAADPQCSRGLRCGSGAACVLGLWVRIPPVALVVCPLWVLCVVGLRSLRRTNRSSRESCWGWCVYMSVMLKSGKWGGPSPLGAAAPKQSFCAGSQVYKVCISKT